MIDGEGTIQKIVSRSYPLSFPTPAIAARYEERYQKFRTIYPAMKELFKTLQ